MVKPVPREKEYRAHPFCGYCDAPLPPYASGIHQWSSQEYAGNPVWLCVECHYLERCEVNPEYAQSKVQTLSNEGKCSVCYLPLTAHNTNEYIASCLSAQRRRYVRSWIDSLREKIAKGAGGWTTEADIVKYRAIIENAEPLFK